MTESINFNGTDYTHDSLSKLSDDKLVELRNLVASNLGAAGIKSFPSHDAAVEQTWKALGKWNAQPDDAPKKKKAPTPKKERGLAKSAEAKTVKRPTKEMFATIKKTGEHDGSQGRQHRWDNYKDGMSIVDIIETEGTEPWDVKNWVKQGIMSITVPTDAEYAERKAAWYKKKGMEDPDLAKERKAKEREEAKAKRDEEKAAKKAEAEAKRAEKKAEAEAKAAAKKEELAKKKAEKTNAAA